MCVVLVRYSRATVTEVSHEEPDVNRVDLALRLEVVPDGARGVLGRRNSVANVAANINSRGTLVVVEVERPGRPRPPRRRGGRWRRT